MAGIAQQKSFQFAKRIVRLTQYLQAEKREYVLSKQLLRSGTSIGANISEAQQAQTKPDFITKISTSLKETTETIYWIKLLYSTDYLTEKEYRSILYDCVEIEKILTSILKTSRK